jgi:hypothetical protein
LKKPLFVTSMDVYNGKEEHKKKEDKEGRREP